MEQETDASLVPELRVLQKQAEASRAVLHMHSKKGPSSKEFLEVYETQLHFLNLEPVASNPLPPYLKMSALSVSLQVAWPARRFWSAIPEADLICEG